MNNDLISRSALKEKLAECGYDIADFGGLFFIIDNVPTVCNDNYAMGYQDGVKKVLSERPKGKWIDCRLANGRLGIVCSVCDCEPISDDRGYYFSDFCPSCGADMREATDDN